MNAEGLMELKRWAEEALEPRTIEVNGVEFLVGGGNPQDLRKVDHAPVTVVLRTLQGLVDFMGENVDRINLDESFVHVEDPTLVRLYTRVTDPHFNRRFEWARVDWLDPADTLPFSLGEFYEIETFVIALQALFVDSDDRPRVLRTVGTIKEEQIRTSLDDGVTQRVTASAGVFVSQEVDIPNPVTLRPYRTFTEVEQPASKFILRAKSGRGETPLVGLFEADGGAWRLDAIKNVADWLSDKVTPQVVA